MLDPSMKTVPAKGQWGWNGSSEGLVSSLRSNYKYNTYRLQYLRFSIAYYSRRKNILGLECELLSHTDVDGEDHVLP